MRDRTISRLSRKRAAFLCILAATLLLTFAASLRYSTPLDGIPHPKIRQLDSGWLYEDGSGLSPLPQLPCRPDFAGETICLVHELSGIAQRPDDVLAIQTRYQAIRVWADQALIYEAAQGKEHALSSMWHFIPSQAYSGASTLRIELTKYDQTSDWELASIALDHPAAIAMYLLQEHLLTILVWLCCMLFSLLMVFITLFMAIRKIEGTQLVLALTAFIFLSGTWILLDSKVTTVFGGNYALTYFFSYCVFYLLPVPLLFYFQLMLKPQSMLLRHLIWIAAGNAGFWMLLHLLGIVSIRNTAVSVHLIIVVFLVLFIGESRRQRKQRQQRHMSTLWGSVVIFTAALASIVLYYTGLLPPTNSAVLYVWSLLALILCMTMDTIMVFGRMWKEKQYIGIYRQLATEDRMTKLANRNAYELRLQELVAHPPHEAAIILFDIDRMKYINDTYGHQMGDQAIALTARCIHEVFGASGECYRIGGDEFCVILTEPCDIPQRLQHFDELVRSRNSHEFTMTVSCGWETRTFEAGKTIAIKDILELKDAADRNLYLSKERHRSPV